MSGVAELAGGEASAASAASANMMEAMRLGMRKP